MSMLPVCVHCCLEMRPAKTGRLIEEMMTSTRPYRLWYVDTFACPECQREVAVRFAPEPTSEHYKPDYAAKAEKATLRYFHTPLDKEEAADFATGHIGGER